MNVGHSMKKKIRSALLCVACDLPAGRKVCGFLGHNASLGCSCCLKAFPGTVGSMDFSGFNRDTWKLRNGSDHAKITRKLLEYNTQSFLNDAEKACGGRYSVLTQLVRLGCSLWIQCTIYFLDQQNISSSY